MSRHCPERSKGAAHLRRGGERGSDCEMGSIGQDSGKRLKAALPNMVESLERHGHLDLDPGVRRRLFSASAATIDRLLRPIREQAGSRRKRKQKRKMGSLASRCALSRTGRSLSLAIWR